MRLAGALWMFWWVHGHSSEGRTFLERALAASEGNEASSIGAKALFAAAHLAFVQSDYERAEACLRESGAVPGTRRPTRHRALPLILGNVAWVRSNTATARSLLEEALATLQRVDDKECAAYSLFSLGLLASSQGEYARACALYEESLALQGRSGTRGASLTHSRNWHRHFLFPKLTRRESAPCSRNVSRSPVRLASRRDCGSPMPLWGSWPLVRVTSLQHAHEVEESVVLYKEMGHRHGTAESLAAFREGACEPKATMQQHKRSTRRAWQSR